MADIDTLIAELRAGLEGTTQGGWTRHEKGIHPHPFVCGAPERLEHGEESFVVAYLVGTNVEANARHIALASPQNIRALLDHIESSGREMDALMAERAEFKRRAEAAETKLDLLQGECDAKRNIIASLEAELARLRAPVGEGEVGRMVAALNDLSEYVFQQPPVDYEEAAAKAMKTAAELLQRLAAPVTEGEVKGVVRSLSLIACAPRCEHASECNCTVLDNAADLIQRLAGQVAEATARAETERQIAEAVELRVTQQEHLLEERRQRISDLIRDGLAEIGKREAAEARLREAVEVMRALVEWDGGKGSKGYDAMKSYAAREAARAYLAQEQTDGTKA